MENQSRVDDQQGAGQPDHGTLPFSISGNDGFWYVEQEDLHTDKKGVNGNPANPLKFLARPGRLERPTYGFVVRHSIQLSYGRTWSTRSHVTNFARVSNSK